MTALIAAAREVRTGTFAYVDASIPPRGVQALLG